MMTPHANRPLDREPGWQFASRIMYPMTPEEMPHRV